MHLGWKCWAQIRQRKCFLLQCCPPAKLQDQEASRRQRGQDQTFSSKIKGWSMILPPGNLQLQCRLVEQNKEVLLQHLARLPQVFPSSAERDWAKSAHHHQSNRRASSTCCRGRCHRRQHALLYELLCTISQSHQHDNWHIQQHRWQCDRAT